MIMKGRLAALVAGITLAIGLAVAQDPPLTNFQTTSSGNVTGAASSVDSEIVLFSGTGGKTLKRATGTGAVLATSGVYSVLAPTDDNALIGNGTTWQLKAVPNCTDTTGNHLNYTASTNAFSCGTSVGTVNLATGVTGTLPVANGGTNLTAAADDNVMVGNATTWQTKAIADCDDTGGNHLNYDTGTNAFSCGTSSSGGGGGTPGGSTTQVQYNNAGAFAGDAGFTYDAANDRIVIASGSATLGQIRNGDGGAATPSYTFAADTDNGMWLLGTNAIAFSTGGTQRYGVDTTSVFLSNGSQLILANTANPQLTTNASIDMTIRAGEAVGADPGNATFQAGPVNAGSTVAGTATLRGGASTVTGVDAGPVVVTGGVPTDGNGGAATLSGAAGVGTNRNGGNVTIQAGAPTGSGTAGTITFVVNGVNVGRFDASATAGQTRFLIYDVDNATLERVTVDAADSCGVGFKCLRIPN